MILNPCHSSASIEYWEMGIIVEFFTQFVNPIRHSKMLSGYGKKTDSG